MLVLNRTISILTILGTPLTICGGVNERFTSSTQNQTILPVHAAEMNPYMEWWLVVSILMCWSKMCWLWLSLCSTTANLPGCASRMLLVFLTLISMDYLVCLMQTRSHSQQMLWPTILMLCLERTLLMQLNVVQASGALNLLRIICLLMCTIFLPIK